MGALAFANRIDKSPYADLYPATLLTYGLPQWQNIHTPSKSSSCFFLFCLLPPASCCFLLLFLFFSSSSSSSGFFFLYPLSQRTAAYQFSPSFSIRSFRCCLSLATCSFFFFLLLLVLLVRLRTRSRRCVVRCWASRRSRLCMWRSTPAAHPCQRTSSSPRCSGQRVHVSKRELSPVSPLSSVLFQLS